MNNASSPSRFSLWQWLDSASLALLIVSLFSQLDIRKIGRDTLAEGLGYASRTFALSLSDVAFALVTAYFVVRVVQLRAWKRLWWPPLPCFALIFVLALTLAHSPTIWKTLAAGGSDATSGLKQAIIEIVQWVGYFLVAPWLFVNLLLDKRGETTIERRDLAIRSLFFTVLASGIAALAQLQLFEESAPRGLWSSPNVYGAALAVVLPLFAEVESENSSAQLRFWILTLVALVVALATVASPWALGAIGIGLIFAALSRAGSVRVRAFRLAVVGALAFVTFTFWKVPESLQPHRAEFLRVSSNESPIKKQYVEWGAALGWNVPRERTFATGFGAGNYQLNIGPLYNLLPNEEKMPPDSNNLYLVQALSTGVLGLGALLWVIGHFYGLAWRSARQLSDNWLGAGVVGSLSAWLFVNLFHSLIVRGAGLLLALLFALAVVAYQRGNLNSEGNKTDVRESEEAL